MGVEVYDPARGTDDHIHVQAGWNKLTGTVSGGMGGETPLEGTVKGNEVKFTVTRQTPNGEMKSEYTATVEGDTMKGSVESPRGKRDWTATKAK